MSTLRDKAEAMEKVGAGQRADQALGALITIQLQKYERHLLAVRQELAPFEERFGLPSEEGHRLYTAGELGDDAELMEWMGLYDDALLYQDRINTLKAAVEA